MQFELAGATAQLQEERQPLDDILGFSARFYVALSLLVSIDTLSIHTLLVLAPTKRASARYEWANEQSQTQLGSSPVPLTSGTNVDEGSAMI